MKTHHVIIIALASITLAGVYGTAWATRPAAAGHHPVAEAISDQRQAALDILNGEINRGNSHDC